MTRNEKKKKAKKAELRNTPEEDPEFQIAPMIDVLLVLLVFFMSISSTEVLQQVGNIDLPVAADGEDAKELDSGQIIINVSWELGVGRITINDRDYPSAEAIRDTIARYIQTNPGGRVLIRGDRMVRYEFMRNIMAVVAGAGVANVTFSTVDKEADDGPS